MKELQRLHKRETMVPKKKNELTFNDRQKALKYLMFIKAKRDGTVKARGCVDRILRQHNTNKVESSCRTVSLELLMMPCGIDTKEERYVIMKDIFGEFRHVNINDTVHMLLKGTIVEHIAKLVPTIYRNGSQCCMSN